MPAGPREREQCLCGPKDGERTVLCDSENRKFHGPDNLSDNPPLDCASSYNITDEESCVAYAMEETTFCETWRDSWDPSCGVEYRKVGDTMMCSAKETVCRSADSRTHDNCVTGIYVICGDACAYKGHAKHSTDAGTRREPDLGAIGLVASAIGATILF